MTTSPDRLYELLPAIYRMRDAEQGFPLQALLRVIAEQVNIIQEDIDQLYANWFIETSQDWVVPYIADLIGYQPVHAAGEPGDASSLEGQALNRILTPRREVANTIHYRRRKGTLALLEQLAGDVAGWPAHAVEFYKRLAGTQSLNALHTYRARTADVHGIDMLERLEGPFDRAAHTVDIRRPNSTRTPGLHNIPSVGLFVWRLRPYSITRAPAYCVDRVRNHYTFSILSNNTPLINNPHVDEDFDDPSREIEVPAWIRRASFDLHKDWYYGENASLLIWRDGLDTVVPVEDIVVADLSQWAYRPTGTQVAVDPRLGRIAFSPRSAPRRGVWVSYHYGFSSDIGGGEYLRSLHAPGTAALFRVSQNSDGLGEFVTINDAYKAWVAMDPKPPKAVIEILDSGAYSEQLDIRLDAGESLEIRAASGTRPVLRLLDWYSNRPDALRISGLENACPPPGQIEIAAAHSKFPSAEDGQQESLPAPSELPKPPSITLDGLLITGRSVVVSGRMQCVRIRHCTLVPGWELDEDCNPQNETEASLELTNTCAEVVIDHSILGAIVVDQDEVWTDPVIIHISDSILDTANPDLPALCAPENRLAFATLTFRRVTVFGAVLTHAIDLAEDSIFNQQVRVGRSQIGCMRFCYVAEGSHTPRRYNCQPDLVVQAVAKQFPPGDLRDQMQTAEQLRVRPQFDSVRYGTPLYARLALCCANEIRRGASDRSEMGAFHDLFEPQREANLRARLEEYTPAGVDAGILFAS